MTGSTVGGMHLSTGIGALDRLFSEVGRADEGLPAGSVVVVQAPPAAQCDSLLAAGIDRRDTHYFTTVRGEAAVRESFERVAEDPQIDRIEDVTGADGLDRIRASLDDLDEGEDVIVEVIDVIEAGARTAEWVGFLETLGDRLRATDSIALLRGLDDDATPANRRYTLEAADFVWNVRPEVATGGKKLEYYLSIPKARGVDLTEDERLLKIDVGTDFYVDKSRNI